MKTSTAKKKAVASGLSVPTPEQVRLADLQFAPYNPRSISKGTLDSLKASLVKHGMVLTLVVQRKSEAHGALVLIGGHQRVRAMRELCQERGWEEPETVPAVVLDVQDPEAKQLNVSLNNIEADFDPHKLGELFWDIRPNMTMDDVLASGFEPVVIDEMIALLTVPPEVGKSEGGEELSGFGTSITLSIEFSTVGARDEAKALLKAATANGHKAGDLVLGTIKAASLVGKLSKRRGKAA